MVNLEFSYGEGLPWLDVLSRHSSGTTAEVLGRRRLPDLSTDLSSITLVTEEALAELESFTGARCSRLVCKWFITISADKLNFFVGFEDRY
jgi:hypothetical protein